jgi:uncharacterized repeat protein (TIGR01451 family)
MKIALQTCLLAAGLLLAPWAAAQAPVVTSTLTAKRVETVEGKAVTTPADAGRPGDVLEYSGTYHNGGTRAVEKLMATIPVPAGTTFLADSAAPARAQASTDGVHFAAMPLMRAVRQADGSVRQQPVPLAEYRFIRWELGTLAAASDAVVKLRVQIDSTGLAAQK